ncbi:hypothetical protein EDF56_10131 [Novosphingobium sp. PhB165]|uniref:hypothetical protein n=1 Tax=Novosphingobium sp. PhB165 TaxID=2485105 RepID=UPI00104FED89|nr:hypothetical protein [Novosphingobium sp. PhB165]TCM21367.1 hypothetical protein EDF56_10131 [Novosphingobium sp. PhB165]
MAISVPNQLPSRPGGAALAPPGARPHSRFAMRRWIPDILTLGIILSALVLPWRVLRPPVANITLSDVLLGACTVALVLKGRLRVLMLGPYTSMWVLGLTTMLGALLFSSLYHGEFVRWPIVGSQYIFALVIVPMTFASFDSRVLHRCIIAFIIGVAISQIVGFYTLFHYDRTSLDTVMGNGYVTGNGRLGAMSGEPNPNGAQCAFALVMMVHAVIARRLHWGWALLMLGPIGWGLLASASFTAFTAAALGLMCFLALSRLSNLIRFGMPLVLLVAAYASLGGPVPAIFEKRVGTALETGDADKAGTFVGRAALIKEAWGLADDNLIIGLGTDRYRKASAFAAPVHQLHLLVLNEGGIVALLGLWLLLGALVMTAIMILREDPLDGGAALAQVGILLIYTTALPHMYTRVWFEPMLIFLAFALAHRSEWLERQRFFDGALTRA